MPTLSTASKESSLPCAEHLSIRSRTLREWFERVIYEEKRIIQSKKEAWSFCLSVGMVDKTKVFPTLLLEAPSLHRLYDNHKWQSFCTNCIAVGNV